MNRLVTRGSPSRLLERLALTGLALATVALGALALWTTIVTQNSAAGLSQAGIQTSGHLRALKLETVTDMERTVRGTALVLIPLSLSLVGVCGWLLRSSRRRSEAAMAEALKSSVREARTDQLTGLANRRALMEALEHHIEEKEPFMLALADLDGFKQYNDTYGHAAGDALLRRLGSKLQEGCAGSGTPARLGGDEFCVLFPASWPAEEVEELVCDALSEEGEGFQITAGCGVVKVPEEAASAEAALHVADIRMYAAKIDSRPSVEHVLSRVLVQMLEERHPGLGQHVEEVAQMAAACAEALGLGEQEVEHVRSAAELHDIGKLAIPESIVNKAGPLSDEEWDFMRRHTVIGERVLTLVPSLAGVATLVRASHERWDGTGYPDQRVGDEIPVGARIISVADAFTAMTEERPYAAARSAEDAIAELRACSGTHFDPVAVEAFVDALRASATARSYELVA